MRRREPENQPHGRAATYRNHGCQVPRDVAAAELGASP